MPMNMEQLKQRLVDTKAIGFFSKLSIKGKAEDLNRQIEAYHAGQSSLDLNDIQERFVLLLQEIVLMVQERDRTLAHDLTSAREALCETLSNAEQFRNL